MRVPFSPVRKLVRRLRPETSRAVYRRVVTLAGESAQVDWGSFGKVRIGAGTRTVSGFVMVLGYSRALAALFTLDQTLESFLRGHVHAFDALGGVARNLVYDNLRSAVLDRRGAAVQFHPRLLELAGHYHFAPHPCTPGRPNEKGKIERKIQYLRHAYFAARPFRDLDDINAQFRRWRDEVAHRRPHPDQPNRSVAEVWAEEKPRLLPLPANPFETDLVRAVRSGKTPYVRFDRNLYSIPHTHVRKPLTLVASATRVRILDGQNELTDHHRTYDTGLTVEDPAHLEGPAGGHPPSQRPHHPRPAARRRPRHRHALRATRQPRRGPCDRTPAGCSPCSTTTDPRSWPRPFTPPSNAMPSVPAPSPTSSKPDAGSADSNPRSDSPCPTGPDCVTSTSGPMTWRPTMPSDDTTTTTTLQTDLRRLGLNYTADQLNDLIALATRKRWSHTVLLEHIVAAELEEKQRRSVESRLKRARLGRFKPLADWDWDWPTALDRTALERILSLDFLDRGDNVVILGAQGLGKTMLAKNIAHQAVLAGHSALFTTAADLLLDLNGQETARALERRLRHYTPPHAIVLRLMLSDQ